MADQWDFYKGELRNPAPVDQRHERPVDLTMISGCYRLRNARTKPDWPVGIWIEEDAQRNPGGHTIVQIGATVLNTDEHADRIADFMERGWLKCDAVPRAAYDAALATGRWQPEGDETEGKPARHFTDAEKLDVIPSTPAEEGGNQMVGDDGQPLDEVYEQIKARIASATKKAEAIGAVDSLEAANKVAEVVEVIRAAGREGEARRKAEKKPFDEGAAAVQAKWLPVLEPASALLEKLLKAVDTFRRAEEARIAREAQQKREAEEKRLREEAEARIREEAEKRQAEQAKYGQEVESLPTDEEIKEAAEQMAAEEIANAPMIEADTTVRIGTAHGKAIPRRATERVGVITDLPTFLAALTGVGTLDVKVEELPETDFRDWLLAKAKKLAKAKTAMPGFKIEGGK